MQGRLGAIGSPSESSSASRLITPQERKKKASELTCNTNKTSETNRAAKSAQIRERSSITGVAEDDRLELSIRMRRNPSKDRFRMALWRPSYTLSTKLLFDTICLVLFLLSKPFHFPLRLFFFVEFLCICHFFSMQPVIRLFMSSSFAGGSSFKEHQNDFIPQLCALYCDDESPRRLRRIRPASRSVVIWSSLAEAERVNKLVKRADSLVKFCTGRGEEDVFCVAGWEALWRIRLLIW